MSPSQGVSFAGSISETFDRAHEAMNPTLFTLLEESATSCDNSEESRVAAFATMVISSTLKVRLSIRASSSPGSSITTVSSVRASCRISALCCAAYC